MRSKLKGSEQVAIRGFYAHLTTYGTVNAALLVLNLLAGGPVWAVWPMVPWGIGVLAHGTAVFLGVPPDPDGGRLGGL